MNIIIFSIVMQVVVFMGWLEFILKMLVIEELKKVKNMLGLFRKNLYSKKNI